MADSSKSLSLSSRGHKPPPCTSLTSAPATRGWGFITAQTGDRHSVVLSGGTRLPPGHVPRVSYTNNPRAQKLSPLSQACTSPRVHTTAVVCRCACCLLSPATLRTPPCNSNDQAMKKPSTSWIVAEPRNHTTTRTSPQLEDPHSSGCRHRTRIGSCLCGPFRVLHASATLPGTASGLSFCVPGVLPTMISAAFRSTHARTALNHCHRQFGPPGRNLSTSVWRTFRRKGAACKA